MDVGLLILRLVVGVTFAAHGTQKLFGWFGGGGIAATAPSFHQLGFRPGRLHASLAALTETVGGLLLAVGFLTPFGSALVISVMLVAAVGVHLRNGFFAQKGGYEYNLVLAGSSLALAFTGPGAISVDQLLNLPLSGTAWGLAALMLGLVSGAVPLLTRRFEPSTVGASATHN